MDCGDIPSLLYSESARGFWSIIDRDFHRALEMLESSPLEAYRIFKIIEGKLEESIDEEGKQTYEAARLYKAIALVSAGKFEEAIKELKTASRFSQLDAIKAKALVMLAVLKEDRKLFEKAIEVFPYTECLNRFLAEAYIYLGDGFSRKNLGRASVYYKKAAELADDIETIEIALKRLFKAYLKLGEKEKAYNALSLLISNLAYSHKDLDEALLYSGAVAILLGKHDEAIRYFERVKKLKGLALLGEALAYSLLEDRRSVMKLSKAQRLGYDREDFKKFFSGDERIELRKLLGRRY